MAQDSSINSKQLRKELEKKTLNRMYLFLGDEEGEKDKLINYIIDKIHDGDPDRANSVRRFYIEGSDDINSAAAHALSASLFSKKTTCIIKNIHNLKTTKDTKTLVKDLLSQLPDNATLIMTAEKYQVPGCIGPGELGLIKVVKFWKFYENDITDYIRESFRKAGMNMGPGVLERLMEISGRDIRKIDEAVETLKYSGFRDAITREVMTAYLNGTPGASLFGFISSLYMLEPGSLKMLGQLLDEGTPELVILSNLTRQAEMIEKYHSVISGGAPPEEAMKKCGIFTKETENFRKITNLFTPQKIAKIFPMLSRADLEIKSGGIKKSFLSNPVFTLATEILMNFKSVI